MFRYENLKKLFFMLEPENAHNLVEISTRYLDAFAPFAFKIFEKKCILNLPELRQSLLGMTFSSPVGLAAGFDKNATMSHLISSLGFSHLEYGTVTLKPQLGNEKPRLFRLVNEESLQNFMGFNSDGVDKLIKNLNSMRKNNLVLGANIGKNKESTGEQIINDYYTLIERLDKHCDYFCINISSPNTPGLRDLQNESFVKELFGKITTLTKKPIFLKIAPDGDIDALLSVCACAVTNGAKGIVATNTTVDYSLANLTLQKGGLSGQILKEKSFEVFEQLAKEFFGKTLLISVGGINSAQEAYRRIKAGASLVQIYTSFIYEGPYIVAKINKELSKFLIKDGFSEISQAIGIERK